MIQPEDSEFIHHRITKETKGDSNRNPEKPEEAITEEELIDQLEAYVHSFDKMPPHVQFSPAFQSDVYYPMLIVLNILKKRNYGR